MDITKIDEETTFTLQKIIYDALCITRTPDDPLPIEAVNALTDLANIARISERQWRQSNQEYPRWHGWTNWETWLVNLHFMDHLTQHEIVEMDLYDRARYIKDYVNEYLNDSDIPAGFITDLVDISSVNWHELASVDLSEYSVRSFTGSKNK